MMSCCFEFEAVILRSTCLQTTSCDGRRSVSAGSVALLSIGAPEMCMADERRCWQDIAHLWRTGMLYPFPTTCVNAAIINPKRTLKSQDTCKKMFFKRHQQIGKTFNSTNRSVESVGWPFARGVAHVGSVDVSINCSACWRTWPPPPPPHIQGHRRWAGRRPVSTCRLFQLGLCQDLLGGAEQARIYPTGAACGSLS